MLSKVHPLAKFLWLILILIISFLDAYKISELIILGYIISLYFAEKTSRVMIKNIIKFLIIVVLAFSITQSIFYTHGKNTISLMGFKISIDGLLFGFTQSLIIVNIVSAATLISLTTPAECILYTLYRIGLKGTLSIMLLLAIKIFPEILQDIQDKIKILKSKGLPVDTLKGRINLINKLITSIFVSQLRKSTIRAIALSLKSNINIDNLGVICIVEKHTKYTLTHLLSLIPILISIILFNKFIGTIYTLPPWAWTYL